MKTKMITALVGFILLGTLAAEAQSIRQNGRRQQARIRQGVRSGEITRAEAVNLRNGQREIRQDMREARADGVVTPGERREIRQDQRQESRKIFRKKHNRRDRN